MRKVVLGAVLTAALLGGGAFAAFTVTQTMQTSADLGEVIAAAYEQESAAIAAFDCAVDDIACLSDELMERFRVDQWVRGQASSMDICGAYAQSQPAQCQMQIMGTAAFRGDVPNLARLKDIMEIHGWPGPPLFSTDVQRASWYIAQHGQFLDQTGTTRWDAEFAESILPDVLAAVEAEELTPWAYAAMFDRIRTMRGEPQRYGTQVFCQDGKADFTFEDADRVDAFRAEIGMDSFDQTAYDAYCG